MYTKEVIIDLLEQEDIPYKRIDHPRAQTMDELDTIDLPYPDRNAKNVFVHDRKKHNYFLITVMGDKRVDLQQIRDHFGTSRLSFAKEDDLDEILSVETGSISPFSILNDDKQVVQYVLDSDFLTGNGLIAAHPNENTVSIYLNVHDLVEILEARGHPVTILTTE